MTIRFALPRRAGFAAALGLILAGCGIGVFWPSVDLSTLPEQQADALIAVLEGETAQCPALLDALGVDASPVPDARNARGCGYTGALRVRRTTLALSAPFIAECRTVAALVAWEIGVLRPEAQTHFGAAPDRINHLGTYNCRTVNRTPGARLSQHALGRAIDIAGVRLDSGRTLTVRRHYNAEGAPGAFMKAIFQGACGAFRGVIGPDRDAAHAGHFHLDMGDWRFCR